MAKPGVPTMLRPLVRAWLWSKAADAEAVPRPSDGPDQRLPGPDPLEVLLVGSGAASSWGVLSHSLGLAGALARSLRTSTERGVVVRTAIDQSLTASTASVVVRAARADFDAVRVVVLGVNETLEMVDPRVWRRRIEEVLDALEPSAEHPAVIAGVQPISSIPLFAGGLSYWLDRHAVALNHETAAACASRPHTIFSPMSAPPRASIARYRTPADYHFWASQLTASAVTLIPRVAKQTTRDPWAEPRRKAELTRLGIRGLSNRFAIDDVVQAASTMFGTQAAGLVILDEDRTWYYSGIGTDRAEVSRDNSFASYAIDTSGEFIVSNASEDERFRNNMYVTGPPHMRFYAGHAIEGPNGQRVGVLCIYDPEPREFDAASRELLRRLALQIQGRLHDGAARSA